MHARSRPDRPLERTPEQRKPPERNCLGMGDGGLEPPTSSISAFAGRETVDHRRAWPAENTRTRGEVHGSSVPRIHVHAAPMYPSGTPPAMLTRRWLWAEHDQRALATSSQPAEKIWPAARVVGVVGHVEDDRHPTGDVHVGLGCRDRHLAPAMTFCHKSERSTQDARHAATLGTFVAARRQASTLDADWNSGRSVVQR